MAPTRLAHGPAAPAGHMYDAPADAVERDLTGDIHLLSLSELAGAEVSAIPSDASVWDGTGSMSALPEMDCL